LLAIVPNCTYARIGPKKPQEAIRQRSRVIGYHAAGAAKR